MTKILTYLITCVMLLALVGCVEDKPPKVGPERSANFFTQFGKDILAQATRLSTTTQAISTECKAGLEDGSREHYINILALGNNLGDVYTQFMAYIQILQAKQKDVANMEAWGIEQQRLKDAAYADAANATADKYRSYSGYLFLLSLACGAGFALLKNPLFIYVGVMSLLGMLLSLAIVAILPFVPYIIGTVLVAVIVIFIIERKKKNETPKIA